MDDFSSFSMDVISTVVATGGHISNAFLKVHVNSIMVATNANYWNAFKTVIEIIISRVGVMSIVVATGFHFSNAL